MKCEKCGEKEATNELKIEYQPDEHETKFLCDECLDEDKRDAMGFGYRVKFHPMKRAQLGRMIVKVANALDDLGMHDDADVVGGMMSKVAEDGDRNLFEESDWSASFPGTSEVVDEETDYVGTQDYDDDMADARMHEERDDSLNNLKSKWYREGAEAAMNGGHDETRFSMGLRGEITDDVRREMPEMDRDGRSGIVTQIVNAYREGFEFAKAKANR